MKKVIAIMICLTAFLSAASAQSKAVGIRGGYGVEANYQHTTTPSQFLELGLGLGYHVVPGVSSDAGLYMTGVYDFIFATVSDFHFYAGPGVGIGFYNYEGKAKIDGSIVAQVGVEYCFKFPMNISFDWRPLYSFNNSFNMRGVALGIRYRF